MLAECRSSHMPRALTHDSARDSTRLTSCQVLCPTSHPTEAPCDIQGGEINLHFLCVCTSAHQTSVPQRISPSIQGRTVFGWVWARSSAPFPLLGQCFHPPAALSIGPFSRVLFAVSGAALTRCLGSHASPHLRFGVGWGVGS